MRLSVITPLLLGLLSNSLLFADETDRRTPRVVREAPETVEVLIRYSPPTKDCFPDLSAKVRMIDSVVILADLELYRNLEPDLKEGLVAFETNGKWGACNKDGDIVIAPRFESWFEFESGLAAVVSGGKLGYINKKAKWVIRPKFDSEFRWWFVGNVCPVQIGKENAVIDRSGGYVWKPGLVIAEGLAGGIRIQTKDGRTGFLDDNGALIPNEKPNGRYFKQR